ncbi:unnamed protein product, partial [Prorocentrum cordatum]
AQMLKQAAGPGAYSPEILVMAPSRESWPSRSRTRRRSSRGPRASPPWPAMGARASGGSSWGPCGSARSAWSARWGGSATSSRTSSLLPSVRRQERALADPGRGRPHAGRGAERQDQEDHNGRGDEDAPDVAVLRDDGLGSHGPSDVGHPSPGGVPRRTEGPPEGQPRHRPARAHLEKGNTDDGDKEGALKTLLRRFFSSAGSIDPGRVLIFAGESDEGGHARPETRRMCWRRSCRTPSRPPMWRCSTGT